MTNVGIEICEMPKTISLSRQEESMYVRVVRFSHPFTRMQNEKWCLSGRFDAAVHFNQRPIKVIIVELQIIQVEANTVKIDHQVLANRVKRVNLLRLIDRVSTVDIQEMVMKASEVGQLICIRSVVGAIEFTEITVQLGQFAKFAGDKLRKNDRID